MPHRPPPLVKERSSPEPHQPRRHLNNHHHHRSAAAGSDYEMADLSHQHHVDSDDEEMHLSAEEAALRRTHKDSSSYRQRGQGQTLLSTGLASMPPGKRIFGLNLADAAVVRHLAINALLIGLWYFFSLSISLYNQWMFSSDHLNFKFPLFTTCVHMLVQFALASLVLYFFPRFRPPSWQRQQQQQSSAASISSQADDGGPATAKMSGWYYLTAIVPCGATTALDIGLGNTSNRFINLTFYTMCKSSVLGFVLLFAFLFRLERPSVKLLAIIAVMAAGVVLMVTGEPEFDTTGLLLIMSASAFSGLRWALTQLLLLRNPATGNPFSSLFYLAPVMFATLLLIALPAERIDLLAAGLADLAAQLGRVRGALLLLFPGTLAFCMVSSEFALLKRTSVVTLSVCGIFKEVVTILAAQTTLDKDPMNAVNLGGLAVTIASIATYNYIKVKKLRAEAADEVRKDFADGGVNAAGDGMGGDSRSNVAEERPMLADQDGLADPDEFDDDGDLPPASPTKRRRPDVE